MDVEFIGGEPDNPPVKVRVNLSKHQMRIRLADGTEDWYRLQKLSDALVRRNAKEKEIRLHMQGIMEGQSDQ